MNVGSLDPIRLVHTNGGQLAPEFEREELIGVSFAIAEDLSEIPREDVEEVVARYWRPYRNPTADRKRSIAAKVGPLRAFLFDFAPGDVVLARAKGGWLVGRIASDYYYRDGSTHPHCRRVHWLGRLTEHDVSPEGRSTLATQHAAITIGPESPREQTRNTHAELIELLGKIPEPSPAEAVRAVKSEVNRARLRELSAILHQAQDLVAELSAE